MKRISNKSGDNHSSKYAEVEALEYSSVQKAIGILLSFLPDNKPNGNLDLSKSLGMNKSTVSRLARVLTHYGLLQQDEETQKYELGRTAAHLGLAVEASQGERLEKLGQRYVEHLRDVVKESVCLETLDAVYLESNYDPHMLETGPYPYYLQQRIRGPHGHLSNPESAELIKGVAKRLKWAALAHLSEQNNHPDVALDTHRRHVGKQFPFRLASRYEVSEVMEV